MRHIFLILLFFCVGKLPAQVLVHKEPRHRPVFENNKIRILDVLLPVGDTTQYHIHHTPSLFIYFSNTSTGSQLQGHQPSSGRSVEGTLRFENLAEPNVRIHRVWNIDTIALHVMDIELLYKDSSFVQKPLSIPDLQLAIDTPWVRVYKITVNTGKSFKLKDTPRSLVLVSFDSARLQLRQSKLHTVQPGSFSWINAGEVFELKNIGEQSARFVLLELPGK